MKLKYSVTPSCKPAPGYMLYDYEIGEAEFEYFSLESLAEEMALEYYTDHDGWESTWPMHLHIYQDDQLLGTFKMEIDYDPTFTATEADPEQ
ncbi:hypothetical protein [Marisediminitalea sp.]|uniref:hypothetical protein n=1 Tax=Marisediminitalea sp. TaxID=2662268 RepID=UPI003513EF69